MPDELHGGSRGGRVRGHRGDLGPAAGRGGEEQQQGACRSADAGHRRECHRASFRSAVRGAVSRAISTSPAAGPRANASTVGAAYTASTPAGLDRRLNGGETADHLLIVLLQLNSAIAPKVRPLNRF